MNRKEQVPAIVIALPFAYRDGIDKYNGIMRYLRESGDCALFIAKYLRGFYHLKRKRMGKNCPRFCIAEKCYSLLLKCSQGMG